MVACACGSELPAGQEGAVLCPACLLRLALEPGLEPDASESAPAQLLGPVGRGPHGIVHLAVRPDHDPQIVTVKVIEAPTDVQRFCGRMCETVGALESLRHPGVPEYAEIGVTSRGQPSVIAAYVPGPSLRDYLASARTSVSGRVQLAERICAVVADLHQLEVVHGSIKATNVIVCESADGPVPVLLDTGIVPAIEFGAGKEGARTVARDQRDLHALLADLLGDLAGLVEGTESARALAEMFARRAR
jgi:serine/threonine protein kinase